VRPLFFALLVTNIVVVLLLWRWEASTPPAPVAAHATAGGNLLLLSEQVSALADGSDGPRCYRLGPLPDAAMAQRYLRRLKNAGIRASLTEREVWEPLGYWVFLPPAASMEAAQAIGRRLAAHGVRDYVFIVGAERANAISLGLYSDPQEAQQRIDQLARLGFSAQMERRFTHEAGLMLEVVLPEGEPPVLDSDYSWRATDCQALQA